MADSTEEVAADEPPESWGLEGTLGLIGRELEPEHDRPLLRLLAEEDGSAAPYLAAQLAGDEQWRSQPLGDLLRGLEAVRQTLGEGGVGTRAFNALARAGVGAWGDLATVRPATILTVPNIGPQSLEEVLTGALRAWALASLGDGPREPPPELSFEPPASPPRPRRPWYGGDLAHTFEGLDRRLPGFDLFRRHTLSGADRPTLRELGAESGISAEGVRKREAHVREALAELMEDPEWPLRVAVDLLRERLGPLAPVEELDAALAELDRRGAAITPHPERRALLLWLAEYRVAGDRVVRGHQVLDVTVTILRAAGEPLDLRELYERTDPPISHPSFRSRIRADSRFIRLGVRHYGLSEWGGEPYTTLAEKMREEIERNGGAMDLRRLVRAMVERFDLAETSVLQRARTPEFSVDADGRISRAELGMPEKEAAPARPR